MATTNLIVKGAKNPASVYLRLALGRGSDITVKTGIAVNPKHWDKRQRKIRNVIDEPNREEINNRLAKLQLYIIEQRNLDYSAGEIIDREWLEKTIAKFFARPDEGKAKPQEWKIYLLDFCRWWMENKKKDYRNADGTPMQERTSMQYDMVIDNIASYEKHKKCRLKLSQLTANDFADIALFMSDNEGYAHASVKRKIVRVKFFCKQAEVENLIVSKAYIGRIVVKQEKESYKHPYLNDEEITRIFNLDLSHNQTLDNVRDNFIIGLWTGLRISDFLTRLSTENLDDGFIDIKTKKTGHSVSIPMHWQVRAVLDKRKGKLPPKISEQKFNDYIKIICQIAEIDQEMMGGIAIVDKDTGIKRKKIGIYKKYLLVTSHICRRSMATNLFGKVENKVIMDVCGWASEAQMYSYNKSTNRESAIKLKNHWDKQYETSESK